MSELISHEAFKVIEGRPVTSSRIVAEYFGKRHSDVVRAIDDLIEKKQEFQVLRNFARYSETVKINDQGATRQVTAYWMDRKGFSILAMGFTGAKALDFKCAFYDEFERMEKALHPTCPVAATLTIDAAQQQAVKKAVARRAKNVAVHYQTLYRALYDRFQIPRYTELLRSDFDEAIRFIETCEVLPQIETSTSVPEGAVVLTRQEAETFLNVAYVVKYLFQPQYKIFAQLLNAVRSPMTGVFWDAFNDMSISIMANSLARHGMHIEDMNCYKALTR